MGTVVIDSSVLLGTLDNTDALHAPASSAVLAHREAGDPLVIPSSVLSECLVGAFRQGPAVARRAEQAIRLLIDQVQPIDEAIARRAAELRAEHRTIRLPDALVIATGRAVDATTVLTGDKRWKGVDKHIRVIAPA